MITTFFLLARAQMEAKFLLASNLLETVSDLAPEGWELYDEVLHFTPDNLYEQINGRAELFLAYNVKSLTYATFDETRGGTSSVNLSIYDMGTALNAFGVFSVERSSGELPLQIGREAYRSGANHYVWKGQYYIKAIASDPGKKAQEAAWEIIHGASNQLSDSGEEIWGTGVFPQEDLVSDSIKYFLVDALGLDFLQNTFTALYLKDGTPLSAFISKTPSEAEALESMRLYSAFGERYGQSTETTRERGFGFLICEMQRGYDVVAVKGVYLIGVTSVPNREQALRRALELRQNCCPSR